MFDWIRRLVDWFNEALVPVKKLPAEGIIKAVKHPMKTTKAFSKREVAIILIRNKDIQIVGGIKFSNMIFSPELALGWINYELAKHTLEGREAYICDPDIPYSLVVSEDAKMYNPNDDPLFETIKTSLKLPNHILKLSCEALGNIGMTKWGQGFDSDRGSIMVFIFGMFAGIVIFVIFVVILLMLLGMF